MLEPFISAAWCFSFKIWLFKPPAKSHFFILFYFSFEKNCQLVKRNPIKGTVSQATLISPGPSSSGVFWLLAELDFF
jgi:hypothetical protein